MSKLVEALNPEPPSLQASRLAGRREQERVLMVDEDDAHDHAFEWLMLWMGKDRQP